MLVSECMSSEIPKLRMNSTFREALILFKRGKTGILPIVNNTNKLCAALTQSSLSKALLDNYSLDHNIAPYVINKVVTVFEDDVLATARTCLQKHQVAHAIVLSRNNQVCGVLRRADIVRTSHMIIDDTKQMKKALTNSLESLIQYMPTGVLAVDQSGTILVMNQVAESMCNLDLNGTNSWIGQHLSECLPELHKIMKDLPSNQILHQKLLILKKRILITAKALPNEGHLWGGMILLQDLTDYENIASELESTKRLKQTLQTVVDAAYDGLVLIDDQGLIQMVNDVVSNLVSDQKNELNGQPVHKIFPELKLEESLFNYSQFENIEMITMGGRHSLVTKIPIIKGKQPVGAIAKITYRNLNKWKHVIKRLDDLEEDVSYYRGELSHLEGTPFHLDDILTQNKQMHEIIRFARQSSLSISNVLLLGESGTGKELFARGIHNASNRSGRLVSINCAAIPFDLWEAEIFGYEEGAFTGAKKGGKPGKFELAHNGSLFLDEIGDMPISMQVKLLRVLQEKELERVGGSKKIQVNVRIIAATNKNLEEMVENGEFREDLYYRINVMRISIPPLRNRHDDIPMLADAISRKFCRLMHKNTITISDEAIRKLTTYRWPGNVRELENIIERAINVMNGNILRVQDLPSHFLNNNLSHKHVDTFGQKKIHINNETTEENENTNLTYKQKQKEAEKEAIEIALHKNRGNRSAAAKTLGISRSYLYKKINQHNIN